MIDLVLAAIATALFIAPVGLTISGSVVSAPIAIVIFSLWFVVPLVGHHRDEY